MADFFHYRAQDHVGKIYTGTIEADSLQAAGRALHHRGLYITNLEAEKNFRAKEIWQYCFGKGVSLRELSLFCGQIAALLEAGMPLQETLHIMQAQQQNKRLRQAVQMVLTKIESGIALKDALSYPGTIFPENMIFAVSAGEASGNLDFVLQELAGYFESAAETKEKLLSMMLYPAILCGLTIFTGGFIVLYIFPAFAALFKEMQIALPWPTRFFLYVQQEAGGLGIIFLFVFFGGGFFLQQLWQKKAGRLFIDHWCFKIPLYGRFLYWKCTMEIARMLALLLHSGLPLENSLMILRKSFANQYMAACLELAEQNLESGRSLSDAFGATGMFDAMFLQFLRIGENSGDLEGMLKKSADFYEMDLKRFSERILTLAEPVAIIFMGSIIGTLVFSVVLPVFDAMTAMH